MLQFITKYEQVISRDYINCLSHVGPTTWNKLSNNLKTAISVNSFKQDIEKYFLMKLNEAEVEIYSYT